VKKKEGTTIAKALKKRIVGSGNENPAKILSKPKKWRSPSAVQKAALSGLTQEVE